MNTRIAKKILTRPYPPCRIPTDRMVRASGVYRRALRRSPDRQTFKWHCGAISVARARKLHEKIERRIPQGFRPNYPRIEITATEAVLRVMSGTVLWIDVWTGQGWIPQGNTSYDNVAIDHTTAWTAAGYLQRQRNGISPRIDIYAPTESMRQSARYGEEN